MIHGTKLVVALMLMTISALPARGQSNADEENKTNFVFFLVDDLGWADVGCFGSSFYQTPNIDSLCESGMKFTNGYAACPVCSPTRASIMTGRHPVRVDITDWIPGARAERRDDAKFKHVHDRDNLSLEEVTIAEVLRENGYQTFFAGKWHLGDEGHWPLDQGFDFNIGGNSKGSPPGGYYAPWTNPTLDANEDGEYLTERLTRESIDFIASRDNDKPFLLYLSYYNVHTPITPYEKRIEHFTERAEQTLTGQTGRIPEHDGSSRDRQDSAPYASMIAAVDDSVGAILAKLEESGLSDNTVVMFFSDNGGLCTLRGDRIGPTSNLPLRSGKGWLYEGGVREPTIIRAPGVTRPGSVTDTPMVSMDFFPTMLDLAGIELRPDLHADGVSLVPLMSGRADIESRALFWHYPHYHGSAWCPGASVRDGHWKLINHYHHEEVELFNLSEDPGEQQNLAEMNPQKTRELITMLEAWQQEMGARMPEPLDQ
ncbi:MAG: sulfatase [Planctomycetota bacterium]